MLRWLVWAGAVVLASAVEAAFVGEVAFAGEAGDYLEQASGGRYRAIPLGEALDGAQGRLVMVLAMATTALGGAAGLAAAVGALTMTVGAWLGREKVYLVGRAGVVLGALGLGLSGGAVWYLYEWATP